MVSFRVGALAALAFTAIPVQAAWPETPFYTCGRDILDATGKEVRFAGVNWPGHGEPMVPEGIEYSSIADIVSKIKATGFNIIRLTYAIQMIDEHFEDSPNQTLNATLVNVLGAQDGATVLAKILSNNPQFTADTKRLDVFDAVIQECAKQEIFVHLDNHVSKAEWCCPQFDGNAWFNDTQFDIGNWTRGLGYMANRAQDWPAVVSMSLRNELRPSTSRGYPLPYGWPTWLEQMVPAAEVIHSNNSDILIYFSGIAWDTSLEWAIKGQVEDGKQWNPEQYDFDGQIVYEVHNYAGGSCDGLYEQLYNNAFGALDLNNDTFVNHGPVVLSEFGFGQSDGSDQSVYAQCLKTHLLNAPGGPAGFMYWNFGGSYIYRTYVGPDADESYGILNHDWSGYRNQTVIDTYFKPLIQGTLG